MNVLALNCGSSSLKYRLYAWDRQATLAEGLAERIGMDGAMTHREAIADLLDTLPKDARIDAVGHRVVHGGPRFTCSVRLDEGVVAAIREAVPLAPLHNPHNLAGILAVQEALPDVPQMAAFDTAFHHTLPPEAYTYAVPREWTETLGVRAYGFHGLSHLFVSRRAAGLLERPLSGLRLITCHIGNGVSVCAVKGGRSIDTSMGFTPLSGAVMGTRSGDLDPGLLPYVHAQTQAPYEQLFSALYHQSGMLALAGRRDMRDVEAAYREGHADAELALAVYAYRLKKFIGAYAAALDGVDALVFTAGVGENSPLVRQSVVSGLDYLGLWLDAEANRGLKGREGSFSTEDSGVRALVIPTDEERVIVEDTVALLEGRSPGAPGFRYTFESGSPAAAG